jgi:membrane dipeptidase
MARHLRSAPVKEKVVEMSTVQPIPVFDGHNDVLLRLHEKGGSFFERSSDGHIDLPRAREGGLAGGFCAVYVPSQMPESYADLDVEARARAAAAAFSDEATMPPTPDLAASQRIALAMVARLFRIEAESGGQVRVVRTTSELETCIREGIFAIVLHFEGAEALDPEGDALEVLYRAGLRSIGPVWSRPNAFGRGVPFRFPHAPDTGSGLTEAGRELVRSCNRLGVMIDLSHLNEQGFWDVARLSTAPLVATHSNVHAICPSPRNLTDKQLAAIKESDGMVGLNFHVGFLRPDGESKADTPLEVMVQHIDHLVEHLGIERVGFGSDFDGATMPRAIGDATGLPRLLEALRTRGYDEADLRRLAHGNWVRVLRATWRQ